MATSELHSQVEVLVRNRLEPTPFAASDLKELSGGTANFIYRATLREPLPDGTRHVLVKHGEGFVKNSPGFKLTTSRCRIEQECLETLSELKVVGQADSDDVFKYAVRTPRALYFDAESNTQVQEFLSDGIDLKSYALATFSPHTPESHKAECHALGKAIGRWLRALHDLSVAGTNQQAGHTRDQSGLAGLVAENIELQKLKHAINFGLLQGQPDKFPKVLGDDARQAFAKVQDMAAQELEDESQLGIIHGDFWTGNILLPNKPITPDQEVPVFVVDWEMAQLGKRNLDLGQMIAELYELWLYKSITAGLWIIEGFTAGYGVGTAEFAFRTAIQTGAHLVCFGTSVPGWGTPEQNEMVAEKGRDLIMHALDKDRGWFEKSELASLFGKVQ
ncbi:kinase-like domain-containing protein [Microdochium trichocladiopsis]|uniref:Kinase-like domain-containing protein n=1 Tax=Microdochium trichocladiopsis TaxID=1682393 RepID=A0A9P8YBZ1_9PEZI|nr:kinase-like domain-containing protein [Microdochium trichocladiopsis]KAH7037921.1 kinase-like domain-containing protein [Microdochium trichocladiopsis]